MIPHFLKNSSGFCYNLVELIFSTQGSSLAIHACGCLSNLMESAMHPVQSSDHMPRPITSTATGSTDVTDNDVVKSITYFPQEMAALNTFYGL